jgi:hypothetical protein
VTYPKRRGAIVEIEVSTMNITSPIDDYFARRALLKTSGPKGARSAGWA